MQSRCPGCSNRPLRHPHSTLSTADADTSLFEANTGDATAHDPAEAFATYGDSHLAALSATPDSDATRDAHGPAHTTGNSYTIGSRHPYSCAHITGAAATWTEGGVFGESS